ncbi:hypothetical protein IT575_05655 [bacterium]|nr:hypothetical protein [bacterium]
MKSFSTELYRRLQADARQQVLGAKVAGFFLSFIAGAAFTFHWAMLRGTPLETLLLGPEEPITFPPTAWIWPAISGLLGVIVFLRTHQRVLDGERSSAYKENRRFLLETPVLELLLSDEAYQRLPSLGKDRASANEDKTKLLGLKDRRRTESPGSLQRRFSDLLANFDLIKQDLGWKESSASANEAPGEARDPTAQMLTGCGLWMLKWLLIYVAVILLSSATIVVLRYFNLPDSPFPGAFEWAAQLFTDLKASGLEINLFNFWGCGFAAAYLWLGLREAVRIAAKREALIDLLQGNFELEELDSHGADALEAQELKSSGLAASETSAPGPEREGNSAC